MTSCSLLTRRGLGFGVLGTLMGARARAASPAGLAGTSLSVWHYKGQVSDFFSESGMDVPPYDVNYITIEGGNMVLNAYKAGAMDYAFMSQIPPLFAAQSDSPLRLIAAVQGDLSNSGLLVPSGSKITSIAELRGKKVAYTQSTNHHYYLLKILNDHGMSFSDIQPTPLTQAAGRAAFSAGYLDAMVSGDYIAQLLIEETGARWLVSDISATCLSYFTISARKAALDDPARQAAIGDYLQREQKTWNWIAENPQNWSQVMARKTGIPQRIYQKLAAARRHPVRIVPVTASVLQEHQAVADTFFSAGLVPHRVDAAALWDTRYSHLLQNS